MEIIGLIFAAAGSFYAGYQRGRRVQAIQDSNARAALVEIAERLSGTTLTSLGAELKEIAFKGLR